MTRHLLLAPLVLLFACASDDPVAPRADTCGPDKFVREAYLGPDARWEQVLLAEISGVPDSVSITVVYYLDHIPNAADLQLIESYGGTPRHDGHSWVEVTMSAGNTRRYVTEQALESVIRSTMPGIICVAAFVNGSLRSLPLQVDR